jgi:hypothetical protein
MVVGRRPPPRRRGSERRRGRPVFPCRSSLGHALWAAPPSGPARSFPARVDQAENGHGPVYFPGPAQF